MNKITVKIPKKPRAQQLNSVLVSKRCEKHLDKRFLSRSQQKRVLQREQLY